MSELKPLYDGLLQQRPVNLASLVANLAVVLPVLDVMDKVVFFIKDTDARYALVNHSLVQRLGCKRADELIGQTSAQMFAAAQGNVYIEQDLQVLQQGVSITDKLELHVYNHGELGWCLTYKHPIYDLTGRIIGLMGVSLDLASGELPQPKASLAFGRCASHIREHLRV